VLVPEAVAETFCDVRCPLAFVLGSVLSPSHVSTAGSRITHLSMVKHLLKITKRKKNVTRRNLILALTNKPTDDQMHEGINTQKETNALRNNPSNLSIKTVLILNTPCMYRSS
jgi:hypothetical protein